MTDRDFLRQNESIVNVISRAFDTIAVSAAGLVAYAFYSRSLELSQPYKQALLFASILTLILFPAFDNYRSWRGRGVFSQFRVKILSWGAVLVFLVVLSALLKTTAIYSRVWFFTWAVCGILVLFAYRRFLIEVWLARPVRAEERVKQIMYALRSSPVMIRFVPDIFSFRLLLGHAVTEVAGIPVKEIKDRVLECDGQVTQATKGDARVTRTGAFLRRTSRVDYDLYYIQNWTLGFDFKIIGKNFYRGFISENAR